MEGNVVIYNSTLNNNNATEYGGAIYIKKGNVTVNGSSFINNSATKGFGGAIFVNTGIVTVINGSSFINNTANFDGGTICIGGTGDVIVNGSYFTDNYAYTGGAICINGTGDVTVINGSSFINNTAESGFGGAIYTENGSVAVTNGSSFINNTVESGDGGAIYVNGNVNVIDSSFINNSVTGMYNYGGAICIGDSGNVNVTSSSFINNSAVYGTGGVIRIISSGNITIKGSSFINNSASDEGVISINGDGYVTIDGSSFINNTADDVGVISIFGDGYLTVNNSSFVNNSASYSYGGAISIVTGNVTVNGSNFINNTAKGVGGAILINTGNVTCNNSIFIGNNASDGGAISTRAPNQYSSCNADVHCSYCVFVNNTASGNGSIIFLGNSSNSSFEDCWYGVNNPFGTSGNNMIYNYNKSSNFIPSNHLILSLNVDPTTVNSGETINVLVGFHDNETNKIVSIPSRDLILNSAGGSFYPAIVNISSSVNNFFTAGNTAGEYNISATVDNETLSKNITIKENPIPPVSPTVTVLTGEDLTTSNSTVTFSVTLKTVDGDVLGNESVLYILYNDEYHPVSTDSNGVATVTLNNLTIGSYNIRYVYFGNSLYASCDGVSTINIVNNTKADSKIKTGYEGNVLSFNLTSEGQALSGQNITVNINGTNVTLVTDNDGLASLNLSDYAAGNYSVNYNYPGNEKVNGVNGTLNITVTGTNVTDVSTVLSLNNLTETYGQALNLTGKLLDANGKPLIGMHITLNLTNPLNGLSKIYSATTDTNGEYQLEINLYPGEYTVSASFNGLKTNTTNYLASGPVNGSILVNKAGTVLSADKFQEKYGAGENFTGKLLNSKGEAVSGQHIAIKLTRLSDSASKVYYATTDNLGEYQLAINLFKGEYSAECTYTGTSIYTSSDASTSITVTA